MKRFLFFKILILYMGVLTLACVQTKDFEVPDSECVKGFYNIISIEQLAEKYQGSAFQIHEDLIVEGYIVSSDKQGNIYGGIYLQNSPVNPTKGMLLEVDAQDTYLQFPFGSKVFLKAKGLFMTETRGGLRLGGAFTSFGNLTVGRLPALKIQDHLFLACEESQEVTPKRIKIEALKSESLYTLVEFEGVEFISDEVDLPMAEPRTETQRTLTDCFGNELIMANSGYADFYDSRIPSGNGNITGLISREGNKFSLILNKWEDLVLQDARCEESQMTTDSIFISELADPVNNTAARFIELYNANDFVVSFKGWKLRRYTNANSNFSAEVNLSGFNISPKSTFLIAVDSMVFKDVYGLRPHKVIAKNGPADSNGDDNIELIDPFGQVIDMFGRIGEDGSGTDHDFTDGRAQRQKNVLKGSPIFNAIEWNIVNGTFENSAQFAPDDFSPGEH
jgi:hypothetical protein